MRTIGLNALKPFDARVSFVTIVLFLSIQAMWDGTTGFVEGSLPNPNDLHGRPSDDLAGNNAIAEPIRNLKGRATNFNDGTKERLMSERNVTESIPGNWGLDRIDQETPDLDSMYKYKYDGTGVTVCYVGSGTRLSHAEFGGRAYCQYSDFGDDCEDMVSGIPATSLAGVAAGASYGVAKNATIAVVKISVASERYRISLKRMVVGVEECTKLKREKSDTPMVLYIGPIFAPGLRLTTAVKSAIEAGAVVVATVGDTEETACRYRPGRIQGTIAVGATNQNDTVRFDSNYGRCVDIFAPGTEIEAPFGDGDTATILSTGFVSAAFVAGVAALHLQKDPTLSPEGVWKAIESDALKGAIDFSGSRRHRNSPNLLLNTKSLL